MSVYFSSFNDSTITRLQLSDGAVLATLPTGDDPESLAFDGKSVWVANGNDDTVTRFSSAHRTKTLRVGDAPLWLFYDGTSMWVANYLSNTVSKLTP